ncbi:hypothetical protein MMC11_005208 [Xylographa trunciseda]|nr:hypothetical protein [Xylographa trunciseda]
MEAMTNDDSTKEVEPEARICSSIYPITPKKPVAYRLNYSTPRSRYCGQPQLPPTPEPTPTKFTKRSASHAFNDTSYSLSPTTKRRHTDPETSTQSRSLFRRGSIPRFSIMYRPSSPQPLDFSADELKRTCEAVLRQVDWEQVQEYAASNRSAVAYKKAIKSILQAEVDRLIKVEDEQECLE